jgi:hypothetical protein
MAARVGSRAGAAVRPAAYIGMAARRRHGRDSAVDRSLQRTQSPRLLVRPGRQRCHRVDREIGPACPPHEHRSRGRPRRRHGPAGRRRRGELVVGKPSDRRAWHRLAVRIRLPAGRCGVPRLPWRAMCATPRRHGCKAKPAATLSVAGTCATSSRGGGARIVMGGPGLIRGSGAPAGDGRTLPSWRLPPTGAVFGFSAIRWGVAAQNVAIPPDSCAIGVYTLQRSCAARARGAV